MAKKKETEAPWLKKAVPPTKKSSKKETQLLELNKILDRVVTDNEYWRAKYFDTMEGKNETLRDEINELEILNTQLREKLEDPHFQSE